MAVSGADVELLPAYWDVRTHLTAPEMAERLYIQLYEWHTFARIKPPANLAQEVYNMIGPEAYHQVPTKFREYVEKHITYIADEKILGVCDRDPKRRWRSYGPTYIVRIMETIFSEQKIGSLLVHWDTDIDSWVHRRWQLMLQLYPARFLPGEPLDISHLTYNY